jgi:hypothetical protein
MRGATDSSHGSVFPTQNREDEVHQGGQCTYDATLYTGQVRYVNYLTTLFAWKIYNVEWGKNKMSNEQVRIKKEVEMACFSILLVIQLTKKQTK